MPTTDPHPPDPSTRDGLAATAPVEPARLRHPWPNLTDLAAVRRWNAAHSGDPVVVRAWAAPLLTAAEQTGPTPALGTPDWQALPDTDPRKLGAALHTALVHLAENTEAAIAARLRTELDDFATAVRRMFKQASAEVSRAVVEAGYAIGPSHAELVRRRNTYRCHACAATYYGAIPCPECGWAGTPEDIRACVAAGCNQLAPGQHRTARRRAA